MTSTRIGLRPRRRWLAQGAARARIAARRASLGLAVGLLALNAGAEAPPGPGEPPLEWQAPASCPTHEDVLARVAGLVAEDEVLWSRFERIRAVVTPAAAAFTLRLEFIDGHEARQRLLSSARCADLADAAAVAIVLAHRGDPFAPAPGEHAARAPEPAAVGATRNAPEPASDGAAALRSEAPGEPGPALGLAATADALLDPATLGSAALGAGVGVQLELGAFSLAAYGLAFPSVHTRVAAGQAIALRLLTGGLRACHAWVPGLDTCAHVEAGQVASEGIGLTRAARGHDAWLAPGLSLAFTSTPFDGFGITTRLSAFRPMVRARFRVDESEVVHEIPGLSFRAAVGLHVPLL